MVLQGMGDKVARERATRIVIMSKKQLTNLAIIALPSYMVVKKFILPPPDPPNLTTLSRKTSKRMIPTVLQEAIGGEDHSIIRGSWVP